MSDKPGVPQPSKSKPTPAVPQPIAQPRAPNLDGGRGAPAPNGVGRGGARDGRGDTFAGRVRAVVSAPRTRFPTHLRRQRPTDNRRRAAAPAAIFPLFARGRAAAPGTPPEPHALETHPNSPLSIIPQPRRPGNSRCAQAPGTDPPLPARRVKSYLPRSRKPRRSAPFRAAPSERFRVRPWRPRANS